MRVCFGEFTYDAGSRELLRGGAPVHLSPKAFEVLGLLLEKRPRAVAKAECRDRLWPKTFVSEANLASLVKELRGALGDRPRTPRYVRTVYGFGYAFCAEATEASAPARGGRRADVVFRLIWGTREIALNEGENVLGRTADAVAWLDSPSVSRRHARIVVAGGVATLEDLGSKNGTRLRGEKIGSAVRLQDSDQIRVGSVLMTFRVFPAAGSTVSDARR